MGERKIKYAEGVEPAPKGEARAEFLADIEKSIKRRISIMLDEDVLEALKLRAKAEGDGRYQTYLNSLLRKFLLNGSGLSPEALKLAVDSLAKRIDSQQALIERALGAKPRIAKAAAKSQRKPSAAKARPAAR